MTILFKYGGITDLIFRVFMVYLACSPRPMHEVMIPLDPFDEDLYNDHFLGMNFIYVTKEELQAVRQRLHDDVRRRFRGEIADFLRSLHQGEPDFGLLGLPQGANLPAVRWKVLNILKLKEENPKKHALYGSLLEDVFRSCG